MYEKYLFKLKSSYFDNLNCDVVKFKNIIYKGKAGGTPKSSEESYYDGDIPFLSINDMTNQGKYINSTSKHITHDGLENSNAWIVPRNSILYSIYASIGFVSINNIELTTSQAIYGVILNDSACVSYIYHYLNDFKRFVHKFIETGTQGNLNSNIVRNIDIKLPSIDEQLYYSNIFDMWYLKILQIDTEIGSLKMFKKGLLGKMFC